MCPRTVLASINKPSLLEIPGYSHFYSLSKKMDPSSLML